MKKAIALEGCLNSRRRLLRQLSCFRSACPPSASWPWLLWASRGRNIKPNNTYPSRIFAVGISAPAVPSLPADDQFSNQIEHANFLFFWEQANPQTGLIKDRCTIRANDTSLSASIASTGFGLTAICIGEKRGFVSYPMARLRVFRRFVSCGTSFPRIAAFFTLRKYEYRRAHLGLGSFLGRYRHPALRRAHLPAVFSG